MVEFQANYSVISPRSYSTVDIVLVSIAGTIFVAYQLFFAFQIITNPQKTNLGVNLITRKNWVQSILRTPNIAINGIQALRNGLMSSSFFASTSIVITLFAGTAAKGIEGVLLQVQLFVLALVMGWTFLHWLLAVKGFTHCTFLFGIVPSRENYPEDEDYIQKELDHRIQKAKNIIQSSTIHYFIGIRGYFLSLCVGSWIFHPIACLVVTVFLVIFMYLSDHSFE